MVVNILRVVRGKKINVASERCNNINSPTNSTGKTAHFFAMVTFLSGADTTAFGVMCRVFSNHHKLVSLRTCNK